MPSPWASTLTATCHVVDRPTLAHSAYTATLIIIQTESDFDRGHDAEGMFRQWKGLNGTAAQSKRHETTSLPDIGFEGFS